MHYVVRRPFRNRGEVILPGTFVDPATIKFFKRRLSERTIVEITKDSFKAWQAYFKAKLGVDLVWPEDQKPDDQNPDDHNPDDQSPDDQKPKEQKPKVVVTAKSV